MRSITRMNFCGIRPHDAARALNPDRVITIPSHHDSNIISPIVSSAGDEMANLS